MQMKTKRGNLTSLLLCMMLIVAMAFTTTGCNGDNNNESQTVAEGTGYASTETNVLGEGETQFLFTVVDKDGNETHFEIHTDKDIVGDALTDLGLIDGDEGEYGLYVKTVNGITADYDTDQTYWAFYINDEYAMTGVDSTDITDGDSYTFKVEK